MANGNFLSSKKGQTILNVFYSVGAAVVIVGALFKILHLPGANVMLMFGLGTEALIFLVQAFVPVPTEYHWENVHPELVEEDEEFSGLSTGSGSKGSLTQNLDDMLAKANVEQEMISRLGTNLGKLSDNVSKMGDLSSASLATEEYASNAKAAAGALGKVKNAYESALASADGLANTLDSIKSISESTGAVQSQMSDLQSNLSSLNKVYGNMLSAMKA
ncbi:MAG: gliding motility protein GldL [Chitinophagales bacterium]|nr:gliding motility protein GldL [Chitinophagales bacterium]